MPDFSMDSVKPSDFDLHHDDWQRTHENSVARQIVIVCRELGNTWSTFSFKEYLQKSSGIRPARDRHTLHLFVSEGVLKRYRGRYSVAKEFIRRYASFMQKEANAST